MSRLKIQDIEDANEEVKGIYKKLTDEMGTVLNIFKGMANSPAAFKAFLSFHNELQKGELAAAEREVIALTTAQLNDCQYCLAAHTSIAESVGISRDEAFKIRKGEPLDSKHLALANFAREVIETNGLIIDDTLSAIREAGYSDGQIVEIIACIALNFFTNIFNHVNDTELDFSPV